MTKESHLKQILDIGIVAAVRSPDQHQLVEVSRALADCGVTVVEITMTVPNALDVLRPVRLPLVFDGLPRIDRSCRCDESGRVLPGSGASSRERRSRSGSQGRCCEQETADRAPGRTMRTMRATVAYGDVATSTAPLCSARYG